MGFNLDEGFRSVPANGSERGGVDQQQFDLASEIIELVVLTRDQPFLQTLQEAVGSARRLWHVPSAKQVSNMLLAGQVGILILDAQALERDAPAFIIDIKRQFPDLVLVLAGDRGDENLNAHLISAGTVYRFIHKPMSPGRARLFAEAAVKRHQQQRRRGREPHTAPAPEPPQRGLTAAAALLLIVLAIAATWAGQRRVAADPGLLANEPPMPVPAAEPPALARAAAALAANKLTEPAGDNALELYLQVLARDPGDAAARAGLAETRERLYAKAETALLQERLDFATQAIDTARWAGVDSGRIALLSAQLASRRAQSKAAASR